MSSPTEMLLRQALKHEQRKLDFDTDTEEVTISQEKAITMGTGRPKPQKGVGVATTMISPKKAKGEPLKDYTEFEGLEGEIEVLVLEIAEKRAELNKLTHELSGPDGKSGMTRKLTDLLLRAGCKTCACLGMRTTQIGGENVTLDTHKLLAAGVTADQIEAGKKRTPWTSVKITSLDKDGEE